MSTDDLVDRLTRADGPDRELDAEIALRLGIVIGREANIFYGHKDHSAMVLERDYYDHGGHAPELPHYTGSTDDALTLVPAMHDWHTEKDTTTRGTHLFAASVYLPYAPRRRGYGGSTTAIALCIAALSARARPDSEG